MIRCEITYSARDNLPWRKKGGGGEKERMGVTAGKDGKVENIWNESPFDMKHETISRCYISISLDPFLSGSQSALAISDQGRASRNPPSPIPLSLSLFSTNWCEIPSYNFTGILSGSDLTGESEVIPWESVPFLQWRVFQWARKRSGATCCAPNPMVRLKCRRA